MPYPDEILEQLSKTYHLTTESSHQLRDCLLLGPLASSLIENRFDPALLITLTEDNIFYIPSSKILKNFIDVDRQLHQAKEVLKQTPEIARLIIDVGRIDKLRISDPHERTERKILLRHLSDRIYNVYENVKMSALLTAEIVNGSRALTLHLNSEVRWLQKEATPYFQHLFSQNKLQITEIEYLDKVEGVQLGNRMWITYCDEASIQHRQMIFIKTHQHGSLREQGSTIKPVDLKELYFYKVLEYTGYGPKAHFFYNVLSPSAFYIATQDEGFSSDKSKLKFFNTYGLARERLDAMQEIPPQIKLGIARTDILLRIFNLWDIIMNSGNFGLVCVHPEKEKWRIIDFRVGTTYDYHQADVFDKYRDGIGMQDYTSLPKKVLNDLGMEERLTLAERLVDEFKYGQPRQSKEGRKTPLIEAMALAFTTVKNYVNEHNYLLQLDLETAYGDLDAYHFSVLDNLNVFTQGVEQHQETPFVSTSAGNS